MRRMMLLVTGAVAGGMVMLLFSCCIAYQCIPAQSLPTVVAFPLNVEGTDLTALQLMHYEGPFWEDRSSNRVVKAAALLLENNGSLMTAEGAVVMEWADATLVFELSALPPGGKVLVLEKDGQNCPDLIPGRCYGWTRDAYPETRGQVFVEETAAHTLAVTNLTQERLPVVQLSYKNRDAKSGVYIGGVAYTVELQDLLPGECRTIKPGNCFGSSSTVVQTIVYTQE